VVSLAMSAIGSQVEAWQGLWTSADGDVDMATVADSAVEGAIPSDLIGTLYRAGPGNFALGGFKLQHPLDGDGLVTAFTFSGDGTVSFRRKFVKTEQRIREQKAVELGYTGDPTKRGFFGSGKQGTPKPQPQTPNPKPQTPKPLPPYPYPLTPTPYQAGCSARSKTRPTSRRSTGAAACWCVYEH